MSITPLSDHPLHRSLDTAIPAIQAAARLSRLVLQQNDKGTISKEDHSPVTVTDFAIQALLAASIHAIFPSDKFVGEESANGLRTSPRLIERVWGLLQVVAKDGGNIVVPESREHMCELIDWCGKGAPDDMDRTWILDPIDGTKTFVRGEMYAINMALLENGVPALSVVALPLLSIDTQPPVNNDTRDPKGEDRGCILFAINGHGTFIRPLSNNNIQPRRIPRHCDAITSLSDLKSITCVSDLDSGINPIHTMVAQQLGIQNFPGCHLLGWVPRWAALALGLGNTTIWVYKDRGRKVKIWDHAGAVLLFEETGGKVTDVDGRELDWAAGRKLSGNYGFVAAPKAVHGNVLQVVWEVVRREGKGGFLGEIDQKVDV
ncbi:3',5'-bisphosphate nucleotidase [Mycena olivaceomarginata]|nr:3',5'-bisphosphate nucleotidase [Mycena olivaceomarginata]